MSTFGNVAGSAPVSLAVVCTVVWSFEQIGHVDVYGDYALGKIRDEIC